MYEHNGKLLVRDATESLIGVRLLVNEDGSYSIEPTGDTYDSRPNGATPTSVGTIMRQYNLQNGGVFPAQCVVTAQTTQGTTSPAKAVRQIAHN